MTLNYNQMNVFQSEMNYIIEAISIARINKKYQSFVWFYNVTRPFLSIKINDFEQIELKLADLVIKLNDNTLNLCKKLAISYQNLFQKKKKKKKKKKYF